jgi:RHS repeat-associated protein
MMSRHRSNPAVARLSGFAVGRRLLVIATLLSVSQVQAQQNGGAVSPVVAESNALVAFTSGASTALSGGIVTLAAAAGQPDLPSAISPLRIEPDPNDVNLVSGKTTMNIPVLSVPGAPNLRFDRVQNSAPNIKGKLTGTAGVYLQSSYTVARIDGSSDSFTCVDFDCNDVTGSGSVIVEGNNGVRVYRQGGTGANYRFDLKHVATTGSSRTTMYYASSVTFQNGEVLTYTYQTVVDASVPTIPKTFYRPTRISSNLGFHIDVTYHSASLSVGDWGAPATAKIYKSTDPTTPLKSLSYSVDGTTITEIETPNRVYTCVGCRNSLGSDMEVGAGSETLPGESTPYRQVVANPTTGLVASVTRDGVTWNYTYLNARYSSIANGYLYDRVTVTGPNGYNVVYDMRVSFSHDRNVMTKMTDSLIRATTVGFDDFFRLTRIVDPEGIETTIAYNLLGNITSKSTRPKPGSTLPTVTETLDFKVVGCDGVIFDISCYRPNWHRDGLGRQTDFVYNTLGQLTTRTDPADADSVRKKTLITWDATSGISRMSAVQVCGDTAQLCNTPSEIKSTYTYWGNTLLPATVNQIDAARGETLTTTNTYDLAGRLKVADGPMAGTGDASYAIYDQYGRPKWSIGPADISGKRQAKQTTLRPSDDKPTVVETGWVTDVVVPVMTPLMLAQTEYDGRRNPKEERVLSAGTTYTLTQRSFDDRGRLTCEARRMNSAAFASPPSDACALGTPGSFGDDRITKNIYDNGSQLRVVQRAFGTGIQQDYATYTYTLNGKQNTVKDANGNLTTYEYDGLDRMSKMIFPSATLGAGVSNNADYEQYGYDTIGNRTSLRKRDGVSITYVPDNLNRVRTKIVPASATGAAGYTVVYGYDVRGLQTRARFGSINGAGITNVYDGFGWLRSSTTDLDGTARPVSYEYDAHGNRTRVMHPDGNYFGYQYEATDNLTLFNENGSAELIENIFDAFGRRQRIERNANTGSITTFTPDNISRLASIALNVDGTATTNDVGIGFSYNPASQVVARSQTNSLYDHQIPVVNQVYTRNGLNQYPSISGTSGGTLGYDLNGNLKSDGQTTPTNYVYDAENRLVSASGAKNATLTYDPMGRLYQVTDAAGSQRFLYDGDRLILEYDGSGVVQRRYAHGAGVDEPMVWYEGSTVSSTTRRYLHADHQGSIVNVADAAGSTLLVGAYDAYGVTTSNTGRFQYTGQTAITQVGLYYYKARFYNPALGRFMQTDPIGYDDDYNLYAYVGNDPLNRTDPTGLFQSSWLLRSIVPGQEAWDSAVTSWEEGNYGQAAGFAGLMLTEQVMTVATLGTGRMAVQTTKTASGVAVRNSLNKQEQRAIRSLEKNIKEHRAKIEEFKKNPTVKPEMEGMSEEAIKRQQERRVELLEKEIKKFEKNIDKILTKTCTGSRLPGNCP